MTQRPYRYSTIPNAAARLTAIVRRLRLTPKHPSDTIEKWIRDERRYYMPPMVNASGTMVFFKGSLQAASELLPSLENEIQLHDAFRRLRSAPHQVFRVPTLLHSGKERRDLLWYTREYFHGRFAGTMDVDLGYRTDFLRTVTPERFVRSLAKLRRLTPALVRAVDPPVHGSYWYGLDFAFYNRFFRSRLVYRRLVGNALPVLSDLLARHKNDLNHAARLASHGDLYPNNLMVTSHGALGVFDWELLNLNNPAFDLSFALLLAWRNSRWQRRFARLSQPQLHGSRNVQQLVLATLCLRFLRHAIILEHPTYRRELFKGGYTQRMIARGLHEARRALPFFRTTLHNAVRGRAFLAAQPTAEGKG
ncbi:MAG: phosphotransferase [Candidatus Kerfeldbacteria bacterium]|nr:phosphotransferase [Candidatus Kerfeldbacteria bacterium]